MHLTSTHAFPQPCLEDLLSQAVSCSREIFKCLFVSAIKAPLQWLFGKLLPFMTSKPAGLAHSQGCGMHGLW